MTINVHWWFTNQSKISSSFVVALDITIIFINIGKVDPVLGGIHGYFKLISELAVSNPLFTKTHRILYNLSLYILSKRVCINHTNWNKTVCSHKKLCVTNPEILGYDIVEHFDNIGIKTFFATAELFVYSIAWSYL